jgi:hypothetical protein
LLLLKEVMGRKKNPANNYFTKETDEAIGRFLQSTDEREREKIYREWIHKPFSKIAEVMYNKLSLPYIADEPLDAQMDCVIFLFTKLGMFKGDKGKAFSYFTIVARNYYILLNQSCYRTKKKVSELQFGDKFDIEDSSEQRLEEQDDAEKLLLSFADYVEENFDKIFTSESHKPIARGFIHIMRNADDYRELSQREVLNVIHNEFGNGKNRDKVTKVANKLKLHYNRFKRVFKENEGIIPFYEKTFLKPKEIGYIVKNYIPIHREFGIVGLARKFDVDEHTVRCVLKQNGVITSI